MDLFVTVTQDEDGVFIADCPSIPGCVSQGRTEPEALANIRKAIRSCLIVRRQRGMPLTIDVKRVRVEV